MSGGSGVGLVTAKLLSSAGAAVVITGRDDAKLRAAASGIAGNDVEAHSVNATSADALSAFFARLGEFDHLILTLSGGEGAGAFHTLDLASLRRAFDAKFWAHMNAAQAGLNGLRPGSSITFVTAASARAALVGTAGLVAVNGALNAIIPMLALELKPVRVNAVSPGVIETPWWDKLPPEARQAAFDQAAASAPVGRTGKPEDVAEAIVFLVTNGFMTGTVIDCDGGIRLGKGAAG